MSQYCEKNNFFLYKNLLKYQLKQKFVIPSRDLLELLCSSVQWKSLFRGSERQTNQGQAQSQVKDTKVSSFSFMKLCLKERWGEERVPVEVEEGTI